MPTNTDTSAAGRVDCHCGAQLLDKITMDTVTVRGERYLFRRKTDYLTCGRCGRLWSADELREQAGLL